MVSCHTTGGEKAIAPILTDDQKPLFDLWKRGRETTRTGTVWVRGADGKPERRQVELGLADALFTEIVGGDLKDGDSVIVKAREVQAK